MNCMCIGTLIDTDGDGVTDADDNCPTMSNVNQADFDGDGMGDVCDGDDDNDGVADGVDCDPLDAAVNFSVGDACNDGNAMTVNDTVNANCACVGEAPADIDGDGIPDSADNCPTISNANQADFDGDGMGDVCDSDDDNDGIADGADCDPLDANVDFSPGDSCNDGNPNTENDEIDANCNCVGTPIQTGPTIWSCPEITFTKEDNTDFNDPANQDFFTNNVIITRSADGGQIFNFANNDAPLNANNVPSGVEWAIGRTSDLPNLTFGGFREIIGRPRVNIVGLELVMHLIEDDIFLNITFTSWSRGGGNNGNNEGAAGGFSYRRATPGDCEGTPRPPQQPELDFLLAPSVTSSTLRVISDDVPAESVSFNVFSQNGVLLKQIKEINTLDGAMNSTIDVSDLEQGLYFIRVVGNNGLAETKQFIKS